MLSLEGLIDSGLPLHKTLFTEGFGFHGNVAVAARLAHTAFSHPDFVLADELAAPGLAESLKRQLARAKGYWAAEPPKVESE